MTTGGHIYYARLRRQSLISITILKIKNSPKKDNQHPQRGDVYRLKKIILISSVLLFLGICSLLLFILSLQHYADQPASIDAKKMVVNIPSGQTFGVTADVLFNAGIIKSPFKFRIIARLKGYDKQLKAGEYTLSASMPPLKILEKLVKGTVKLYKLTVPEGLNLYQIGEIVAKAGFAEQNAFVESATDPAFARASGISVGNFEGYLFPDTYHFPKNVRIKTIITTMVQRFWQVFRPEWKDRSQQLGFSVHQVVTLASIIEKETGAAFERPLISSVFHNRLRKKMRLESDPTVIYGLKSFDGNLNRKHLETFTPYNTYRIKALPPGPIANPGQASLEAALYPADTKYIYFVSKKDSTHQFSTNLKDHNQAVRKYQLRRKR